MKTITKVYSEEEIDSARELFYSKFDVLWQEFQFLKRLVKNVPSEELDQLSIWWLNCSAAEVAISHGATKEDFLTVMGEAFDEVNDSGEDDHQAKALPFPLVNTGSNVG